MRCGLDRAEAGMLHEVIYALSGFPGDVVVLTRSPSLTESATLRVAEGVPLLEKTERSCLDRILRLGASAIDLEFMIDTDSKSLYRQGAFAAAREILDGFHNDVLSLEEKLVAEKVRGEKNKTTTLNIHRSGQWKKKCAKS